MRALHDGPNKVLVHRKHQIPDRHVTLQGFLHRQHMHVIRAVRIDENVWLRRFGWQNVELQNGTARGSVGATDCQRMDLDQVLHRPGLVFVQSELDKGIYKLF